MAKAKRSPYAIGWDVFVLILMSGTLFRRDLVLWQELLFMLCIVFTVASLVRTLRDEVRR